MNFGDEMLNKCKVVSCKNMKPRRFELCGACWDKLPANLQMSVRDNAEKGQHTLRANPSKTWYEKVMGVVGTIKIPYVVGAGFSAVKLADDRREIFRKDKPTGAVLA